VRRCGKHLRHLGISQRPGCLVGTLNVEARSPVVAGAELEDRPDGRGQLVAVAEDPAPHAVLVAPAHLQQAAALAADERVEVRHQRPGTDGSLPPRSKEEVAELAAA
jgi:hypothetical protein